MKKPSREVLDKASCYQWIIKGQIFKLSEMDRGQLIQALMDMIDAMEKVEDKAADVQEILDVWRNGTPDRWDT